MIVVEYFESDREQASLEFLYPFYDEKQVVEVQELIRNLVS